jgi:hypothetical protein
LRYWNPRCKEINGSSRRSWSSSGVNQRGSNLNEIWRLKRLGLGMRTRKSYSLINRWLNHWRNPKKSSRYLKSNLIGVTTLNQRSWRMACFKMNRMIARVTHSRVSLRYKHLTMILGFWLTMMSLKTRRILMKLKQKRCLLRVVNCL